MVIIFRVLFNFHSLAHRDTPARPALFGTTRAFLDYFNLKNLSDLPLFTSSNHRNNLIVQSSTSSPNNNFR